MCRAGPVSSALVRIDLLFAECSLPVLDAVEDAEDVDHEFTDDSSTS